MAETYDAYDQEEPETVAYKPGQGLDEGEDTATHLDPADGGGIDPEDGLEQEEGYNAADEQPEKQGVTFYSMDTVSKTLRPCELTTGVPLKVGDMPGELLLDESVDKGNTFWNEHGSEVDLRILTTRHVMSGDLRAAGIDLRTEAIRLAEKGGVLFIEGTGPREVVERAQALYNIASQTPPEKIAELRTQLWGIVTENPTFSYNADVVSHIMGTGVTVAHADYVDDSGAPADRFIINLERVSKSLLDMHRASRSSELPTSPMPYLGVGLTKNAYRNSTIFGRMGAVLADRHQAGNISYAVWLGGNMHQALEVHAARRGVRVSLIGGASTTALQQRLNSCYKRGEYTPADIEALLREMSSGGR